MLPVPGGCLSSNVQGLESLVAVLLSMNGALPIILMRTMSFTARGLARLSWVMVFLSSSLLMSVSKLSRTLASMSSLLKIWLPILKLVTTIPWYKDLDCGYVNLSSISGFSRSEVGRKITTNGVSTIKQTKIFSLVYLCICLKHFMV